MNDDTHALLTENLRVSLEVRGERCPVVRGVDLKVPEGGSVALVGESGSGKSVTARSIMGLLPGHARVAADRLLVGGTPVPLTDRRAMTQFRRHQLSMVFQDPQRALNPAMKIGDQILEAVRLRQGSSTKEHDQRVRELLDRVKIPDARNRVRSYPHELSGGMRQRVAIAMALAGQPKLLIADEPTTALDVTIQAETLDLIVDLQEVDGMGLLLITHDLALATQYSATTYVMYTGAIVESCPSGSLRDSAAAPYTQALLHSRPEADTHERSLLPSLPGAPPHIGQPFAGCPFESRCPVAADLPTARVVQCQTSEPSLAPVEHGHHVACWHPKPLSHSTPVSTDGEAAPAAGSQAETAHVLDVQGLGVSYSMRSAGQWKRRTRVTILDGLDLQVARGSILGLVGESGCGKSTLLMAVMGAVQATGSVRLNGVEMLSLSTRERRSITNKVQLIPQDTYSSMDPFWTVADIVKEPLDIHRIGTTGSRLDRVREVLTAVGLDFDRFASMRPRQLSGGQLQRVAIARALSVDPDLLIADEAIASLDVTSQAQVLNLLAELRHALNLSMIFVSHDLGAVRFIADEVAVMYMGEIVEVIPSALIPQGVRHHYTDRLYASIPGTPSFADRVAIAGELPSLENPPTGCRFRTRCPAATDVCADVTPVLEDSGQHGHRAACHHPLLADSLSSLDAQSPAHS